MMVTSVPIQRQCPDPKAAVCGLGPALHPLFCQKHSAVGLDQICIIKQFVQEACAISNKRISLKADFWALPVYQREGHFFFQVV